MSTGEVEVDDRPACDFHSYHRPAMATVCMLDTSSLDAMSYVCGGCLVRFFHEWVVDPDRQPYEVRPL